MDGKLEWLHIYLLIYFQHNENSRTNRWRVHHPTRQKGRANSSLLDKKQSTDGLFTWSSRETGCRPSCIQCRKKDWHAYTWSIWIIHFYEKKITGGGGYIDLFRIWALEVWFWIEKDGQTFDNPNYWFTTREQIKTDFENWNKKNTPKKNKTEK